MKHFLISVRFLEGKIRRFYLQKLSFYLYDYRATQETGVHIPYVVNVKEYYGKAWKFTNSNNLFCK